MRGTLAWLAILLLQFGARAHAQIIAFGAGNIAGWNVAASDAIPAQLQTMLQATGYRATVLNAGVPGNTTADMRARVDRDIPAGTTIVVLDTSEGLYNDTQKGISRQQGFANLAAIKTRLTDRHIRIITFSAASIPPQFHQTDGVHLTPQGHRLAASNLMANIAPILGAPPQANPTASADCSSDMHRWCPAALGSEQQRQQCLQEHRARVSRECLRAIAASH
ncbi:MAG: hypothetical protein WDM77_12400 [Steroidobacteraceae bacterium]